MYLSKSQKLLIAKLGKDGIPRAALSVEECQEAELLGQVGAVILRWKGLDQDRYAATAKGLAAIASFGQMVAKHQRRRSDDEAEVTAALFASGWGCHSHFPGSLVLWTKSFPASNRQWIWEGSGEDRRKVPHPPFTVDGATLDVAVTIEAAWQELWDDDRPHLPTAEVPAIEEAL